MNILDWFKPRNRLLKKWVTKLDSRLQSTLMSVLRGSDIDNGNCYRCKEITRMLRYIITNHVGKRNSYMSKEVIMIVNVTNHLCDTYLTNTHWVDHIRSASGIIAKHHPDSYVREYWGSVNRMVYSRVKKIRKEQKKREAIDIMIAKYIDIYTNRYI